MRKNRLYRIGAVLLAGLLVFTGIPQTFSFAEETKRADNEMAALIEMQTNDSQPEDGDFYDEENFPEEDDSLNDDNLSLNESEDETLLEDEADEDTDGELLQPREAERQPSQQENATPSSDVVLPAGENVLSDNEPLTAIQEEEVETIDLQDDPTPAPIPVTAIKLNHNELTMQRNTTKTLEVATWTPANADTGRTVKYVSDDPLVVEVGETSGVVKAVKVPENGLPVTITAKAGEHEDVIDTCQVTVTPIPVDSVTLDQTNLQLTAGGANETLKAYILPTTADNKEIRVESTSPRVATVECIKNNTLGESHDYNIIISPLSEGKTDIRVISVSNPDKVAVCQVGVERKPTSLVGLTLRPRKQTMTDSELLQFEVLYDPANTTQKGATCEVTSVKDYMSIDDLTGQDVTATVKNSITLDLDEDGNGTLRNTTSLPNEVTKREVTVTATAREAAGITASFTVTIKRKSVPAEAISVLTRELVLEDGGRNQTGVVEVKLTPTDTTERKITATVPDSQADIVEVTESAVINVSGNAKFTVTGLRPGTCEITFKAGAATTTFPVTVNEYIAPIDRLDLLDDGGRSVTSLSIEESVDATPATATLTADIMPLQAEDKRIKWSVSDPEIATITGPDDDGWTLAEIEEIPGTDPNNTQKKLRSKVTINAHMVGECTVTATAAGDVVRECRIEVTPSTTNRVTGLTVNATINSELVENPAEIYIKQGQRIDLTPVVVPETANKKVRWSSGGSDVVSLTVGANSVCTVSADHTGTCTLTAQASGSTAECKKEIVIHVVKPRLSVVVPENFYFTPDQRPITTEKIKDKLTVTLFKYETPSTTEIETTLTATEYELEIETGNQNRRPYAETDMEKVGTKMLVVSCTCDNERVEFKDILVEMKPFSEAKLEGVTPLSGDAAEIWNVPNATPVASLPLAKTTEITIVGINSGNQLKVDAEIAWNLGAIDYKPELEEAQEFTVYGMVKLPDYVKNEEGVSLDVSAKVHVREAASSGKKVEAPKFSVLDGEKIGSTAVEVPYGSKIVIESNTEDAVIYYMMDRRPDADRGVPQDEEHRYKSPLEITAKTTTIYAIATKEGYNNSNCSECTIKLVEGEPVIPDDPDDPEPDQVVDTDRPSTGKVPNGLWVAVQPDEAGRKDDFPYTGSAIKPVIHVYNHTTLLTEKKDYTISYKNNVKAGEKGAANSPCIIVKGKGNYSGQTSISFTIKQQSIEDDSVVMDEYVTAAYNKKVQKPNPSLIWNGKKLTKGKDFTITDGDYKEPKQYNITVTGIGNFTGTRKLTYEIFSGGVSVSKLKISKIPNQKCTGEAITPPVVVKYKNTVLRENANYSVQYKNNVEVGTASVIITGLGNYKGTRRVDFKIQAMAKISDVGFSMTFDPRTPVYNGSPVKPVSYTAVYQKKILEEGKDYKVSYANNDKAGTATLFLKGIGRFNGTAKKTFKIQSGDLSSIKDVQLEASYPYEKGGSKPKPKIVSGNYVLQEGKDYTLSYSNNKTAGTNATVTVKGKGNFKGKLSRQFAVTRQDISNLQVVAADKKYRNKANSYRTSVKVIDVNGKALAAGKDYDKEMYYSYVDGPKQGEQVLPTDIIPEGTNLRVEVRVSKPKNYVGTAYGVFRIVRADISKAKVKVDPQEYTGRKKKPGKDQIHVTLDGVTLGDGDYEIVGYQNNVNQGTAKVTIKGVGSYGGTKTANFKIRKRGFLDLSF